MLQAIAAEAFSPADVASGRSLGGPGKPANQRAGAGPASATERAAPGKPVAEPEGDWSGGRSPRPRPAALAAVGGAWLPEGIKGAGAEAAQLERPSV